jgi:hypothetical protein
MTAIIMIKMTEATVEMMTAMMLKNSAKPI